MFFKFLKRCWRSLKGSYKLHLPLDPFIIKDWNAFTKKRWWVFLRPIHYSCWRANLRLSKKFDGDTTPIQSVQDPFGEAMKRAYEKGGLFYDAYQTRLAVSELLHGKKKK